MKRFIFLTMLTTAVSASAQEALSQLEQQATDIIKQMTLEEKFSQMMNETPGISRLGIEPTIGGTRLFMGWHEAVGQRSFRNLLAWELHLTPTW